MNTAQVDLFVTQQIMKQNIFFFFFVNYGDFSWYYMKISTLRSVHRMRHCYCYQNTISRKNSHRWLFEISSNKIFYLVFHRFSLSMCEVIRSDAVKSTSNKKVNSECAKSDSYSFKVTIVLIWSSFLMKLKISAFGIMR